MLSKQSKGSWGEKLIAQEYVTRGYKFIAANVKILGYKQIGELDLIFEKDQTLVFVEVKTRRNQAFMPIAETISSAKQKKLIKAAKAFVVKHQKYADYNLRIDAALVISPLDNEAQSVNIIEDAIQDLS